jgi:uncharacterized protein YecE (DUF72 family)
MPEEDLFGSILPPAPVPSLAAELKPQLAALASRGLFLGTSSWKYPGWCGPVYDQARYTTRGKFSEAKFERECLSEYAQTFRSVCVDAGYYKFPSEQYLAGLTAQVPDGFEFAFKVTEDITVKRFANLPKHGARAGTENPNFLNSLMFRSLFLEPCEKFKEKIGPLIFEFSTFAKTDFENGRDFVGRLNDFLGSLPSGWKYAVEIRNKTWLVPEYFETLRRHNVAHVFNNWTKMPSALEQFAIPGAADTADFMVARLLLKPGRSYEASVEKFQPYREIQEINEDARTFGEKFLEASFKFTRKGYVYVNNRLEGFGPATVAAIARLCRERGLKMVLVV